MRVIILAAHPAGPAESMQAEHLARSIKQWGRELGFQQVGVAGVDLARDEAAA